MSSSRVMREQAVYRDATNRATVGQVEGGLVRLGIEYRDEPTDLWEFGGGAWFYCEPDDALTIADLIRAAVKELTP